MAGTIYTTQLNTARDNTAVRVCFAGAVLTNKQKDNISTLYIEIVPCIQKKGTPRQKLATIRVKWILNNIPTLTVFSKTAQCVRFPS